ncbi:hypothetical protein OG500_28025 [Kitasatospora sp. NBC_01250]|uniref:hypothetical protein n=1 Tax=unclassified Kitasatospora TaxID=2633591 RepID=UPI002E0DB9E1|nr:MULTISPECIES: hypothetical protein [unclassified Kitasatospora]WSJ69935.1 hypothetical protein OG294_29685 [Kitasatospora sp. NBC_01302]
MSYAPPVGGFPTPQRAPAGARPAALPGLAVLMIVDVLLELALLGFDLIKQGAAYLPTALGINYDHFVRDSAVNFAATDTAFVVALVVLIVGAFSGAGWVRGAGVAVLGVSAYGSAMVEIAQLTGNQYLSHAFGSPVSNLLLNLDLILQVMIALAFVLAVAVTRRPAGAQPAAAAAPVGYPAAGGYPAPFPSQGAPGYGAPVAPQPVAGYQTPVAPPAQPPAYGYPSQPPQAPPTA